MNLMLLTAGFGTRFRPQTYILPKPCLPLLNMPLVYHTLMPFQGTAVQKIVANLHHLSDQVKATIEAQTILNAQTVFTEEQPVILGGAGGVLNAKEQLTGGGPFFIANGDEVLLDLDCEKLETFLQFHNSHESPMSCLAIEHPEAGSTLPALWVDSKNQLTGLGRKPIASSRPLHFVGVIAADESLFDWITSGVESNLLYDVAMQLVGKQLPPRIHVTQCEWVETGNLKDYLFATDFLLREMAGDQPSSWVKKFLSLTTDSQLYEKDGALVFQHATAQVSENAELKGFCVFGRNSIIDDCHLENIVTAPGVRIESGRKLQHDLIV